MINYNPFWNTLNDSGISQYELINKHNISAGQLSRMRANKNISTHTINILCKILSCRAEDIIEYVDEGE